ncbi:MAG: hypothetical protein LBI86_01595 [Treponema sp.]|jgi:hypothetical protein|nr:hypothetical protein [Treponema sp.]
MEPEKPEAWITTIIIDFNPVAFKHGITREQIRWAVTHPLYDRMVEGADFKYLTIGPDQSGNLLEIIYNIIEERHINVFHAMKCRKIFYPLIEIEEETWPK